MRPVFPPHMDKRRFGENLVRCRKAVKPKLTQEALAAKAGVQQSDISKWENGVVAPDLPSALKIAGALAISVDLLLEGVDSQYVAGRDLLGQGSRVQPSATHSSVAEGKGDVPASPRVQSKRPRTNAEVAEEIQEVAARLTSLRFALVEIGTPVRKKTGRHRSTRKAG